MPSGPKTTLTAEVRLQLKPVAPATGYVDGAWWPRGDDLSAELPTLLAALESRLGRLDRVTYRLGEWPVPNRRLVFDGGTVRLEGFRSQSADTVTVIGWDRRRLTLLVVPPETGADLARQALAAAAAEGGTDDSAQLLAGRGAAGRTQSGVPLPA
ncbi:DUF5994 family protein [Amycolatopsis sp. lyj-346]|uniref:DUF5994 family protein n=1 Tax=Amycolatopsis sp. lyj-346 TaxID=2789289 RepID=UPI00397E0FB6